MTGETRCHGTTAQEDALLSAGMVHSKEHKPCHQLQEEDIKQQREKRNGYVKTHNHNDVHDERKSRLPQITQLPGERTQDPPQAPSVLQDPPHDAPHLERKNERQQQIEFLQSVLPKTEPNKLETWAWHS